MLPRLGLQTKRIAYARQFRGIETKLYFAKIYLQLALAMSDIIGDLKGNELF